MEGYTRNTGGVQFTCHLLVPHSSGTIPHSAIHKLSEPGPLGFSGDFICMIANN